MNKGSKDSPEWRRFLKRCTKPAAYALVAMALFVMVWAIIVLWLAKCR